MGFTSVEFEDGLAIHGQFPDADICKLIADTAGPLPLVIADPPYGNIVAKDWDRIEEDDVQFCAWMVNWTKAIEKLSLPAAALYVWGGVGKPREGKEPPFRPFLRYCIEVELKTGYNLSTPITWKKVRAYGIQWGYLFTREEVAYLVLGDHKKPRRFNIPLLDAKRGYPGYNKLYPAKSEFLRRSNVWADVTEILRNKVHINEKPVRLMEIPIETHTDKGEWVLDPFAGSGTTAVAARRLGRRFIVVERDPEEFEKLVARIRGESMPGMSTDNLMDLVEES